MIRLLAESELGFGSLAIVFFAVACGLDAFCDMIPMISQYRTKRFSECTYYR